MEFLLLFRISLFISIHATDETCLPSAISTPTCINACSRYCIYSTSSYAYAWFVCLWRVESVKGINHLSHITSDGFKLWRSLGSIQCRRPPYVRIQQVQTWHL